jgi:TrmH family RNA methyltransferase
MENLRVVLVATRNPLNMGAVARAMSNFGAGRLRVVHPYVKAFREARSAVGAVSVLREAEDCETVEEAIADCGLVIGTTAIGNRHIKHPLRSLDAAGAMLRKRLRQERVAIVFGSEKKGLSNEDLSYCHWLLHIPTHTEHQSMNLGQAAAVCFYELARGSRKIEEEVKSSAARMEMVGRISDAMLDCLVRSGFVAERRDRVAEEKLRRMLRRLSFDEEDAVVFLGMMRKIQKKLELATDNRK